MKTETLPPGLRDAAEKAGEAPVRLEDPETRDAYVLVREEDYRRLLRQAAIDHTDRSFYEVGEFRPRR